jgi:hypothetical protein
LLKAMWSKAMKGDVARVDRCLRIMERRAKLLGLDAPSKQEHTGKDGGAIPVRVALSPEQALAELREELEDNPELRRKLVGE